MNDSLSTNEAASAPYPHSIALDDIRKLTPSEAFVTGRIEAMIAAIETDARAHPGDASTPEGREAIRTAAYRISRTKSALDGMGKALTEVWRQQTSAVNLMRALLRERLDKLGVEVRKPLSEFEAAEEKRVAEHEDALNELQSLTLWPASERILADEVERRLGIAQQQYGNRDWQEFADRAVRIRAEVVTFLTDLLANKRQAEADHAELVALRAAQRKLAEEAAAKAAAERERVRIEQAAAALAERQRVAAEAAQAKMQEDHARALREAAEREQVALERMKAAEVMAEARARDEKARMDAAIALALQKDAAMAQAQVQAQAQAEALQPTDGAKFRKHKSEVIKLVAGKIVTIASVGEVTADALAIAIADGALHPHVTMTYYPR